MNKKYKFLEVKDERWAIWYKDINKKGNKIGVYKIFDLYKNNRTYKFAFRYLPRKGQTQDESDRLILDRIIHLYYRKKPVYFSRGNQDTANA